MERETKIKVRVPPGCCIPGTAKATESGSRRVYELASTEIFVDAEFEGWCQQGEDAGAIIRLPGGQIETVLADRVIFTGDQEQ